MMFRGGFCFFEARKKKCNKLIGEILKTISRNVLKNGRNCDKIDNIYKTLKTLGSKSRRGYSGLTEQSGAGLPAEKKCTLKEQMLANMPLK